MTPQKNDRKSIVEVRKEKNAEETKYIDANDTEKKEMFVTALARGLAILRCFTIEKTELGSSDLARLTGLPQPTVWRLCKTLQVEGYLTQIPGSDRLQLTPQALTLGYAALAALPAANIARGALQQIANAFGAACSMGIRQECDTLIVQRCQGSAPLILNLHVGSRLPIAQNAMGLAYLAREEPVERGRLLSQIRKSARSDWTRRKRLIENAITEYQRRRFVSCYGTFHPAINSIGVTFRDIHGTIYGVGCGAPAAQLSEKILEEQVSPQLLGLAEQLECPSLLQTT